MKKISEEDITKILHQAEECGVRNFLKTRAQAHKYLVAQAELMAETERCIANTLAEKEKLKGK